MIFEAIGVGIIIFLCLEIQLFVTGHVFGGKTKSTLIENSGEFVTVNFIYIFISGFSSFGFVALVDSIGINYTISGILVVVFSVFMKMLLWSWFKNIHEV